MSLRMSYVASRDDSGKFQFRRRVLQRVLDRARGRTITLMFPASGWDDDAVVIAKVRGEVKFSLRTEDPKVAQHRDLLARDNSTSSSIVWNVAHHQ